MAYQTRPVKILQKILSVSANMVQPQTSEHRQTFEPRHGCLEKELEIVDKILEDGWNIFIPINTAQDIKNNDKPINTFEVEEKELIAVPKGIFIHTRRTC